MGVNVTFRTQQFGLEQEFVLDFAPPTNMLIRFGDGDDVATLYVQRTEYLASKRRIVAYLEEVACCSGARLRHLGFRDIK